MNTPAKASLPVIKRLPKYYRYLRSLQADGITSISSRELAAQMGTTASQVRQDFNCIGDVNGRQGIGYSVENLLSILESLLFGNGDRLPTILIGCGRLGKAVSRFITTDANGYKLIAAFDVAQNEVGKEINGIQNPSCGRAGGLLRRAPPQGGRALCAPRRCRAGQRPSGGPGHRGLLELLPLRPLRSLPRCGSGERSPGRQPDEPGLPPAQPGVTPWQNCIFAMVP